MGDPRGPQAHTLVGDVSLEEAPINPLTLARSALETLTMYTAPTRHGKQFKRAPHALRGIVVSSVSGGLRRSCLGYALPRKPSCP